MDKRELPIGKSLIAPISKVLMAEPLVHFLLAGLVLYVSGEIYQRRHDLYLIEVTDARVAYLAQAYRNQYGQAPDARMRELLIKSDIDNEILFREGLRLKLDQKDEIVRRRIIQKMQFLAENLTAPGEPTDAQITSYYTEHPARYVQPAAASFTHIFFTDEGRARHVLTRLQSADRERAPELGDRFPDLYDFSNFGAEQVERLFGHTPFSQAVFDTPVGIWSGPFRSGLGWHLLKVSARSAATLPPLAPVRDKVRSDFLAAAQDRQNRAGFEALRKRFMIVRSDTAT